MKVPLTFVNSKKIYSNHLYSPRLQSVKIKMDMKHGVSLMQTMLENGVTIPAETLNGYVRKHVVLAKQNNKVIHRIWCTSYH